MPQILKTLAEYVVETRKRDTFFMVFNTVYNLIKSQKMMNLSLI